MFLLLGTFVLAFVFLNPLYGLVVLAWCWLFGYLAKSLVKPQAHPVYPGHDRRWSRS